MYEYLYQIRTDSFSRESLPMAVQEKGVPGWQYCDPGIYDLILFSLYSTFMSSIYASGTDEIAKHFGVSTTVSLLGISMYCMGLAFGPVLAAPLSETFGRCIVYRVSLPLGALFTIGCGVAQNIEIIIICRFFAGFFAAPALSIGGGSIADIFDPSVRGVAMSLFLLAPLCGPSLGPVIGGFVVETKGWRWLEWVMVFLMIITFIGCVLGAITSLLCDRFLYQKQLQELRAANNSSNSDNDEPTKKHVEPEHRLYPSMIGSIGIPVGLFWFAWTARSDIHWVSPVVATMLFSFGNICVFVSSMTYLIDSYGPRYGASATSANGFSRYMFAAAFPLFAIQMYNKLGIDWATSLLAFISVGLLPIPWILFKWGPKIREKSAYTITER
ncbi:hypothetical protein B7463_g10795, partial [Scytalidium lignicola]